MSTDGVDTVSWATEGVGIAQPEAQEIVDRFHRLYRENGARTWRATHWLGVPVEKCPLDLWVYQELLYRIRPEVIVQTGTRHGGGALFLASMCDLIGTGRVVTIDGNDAPPRNGRPQHPRITYLSGSSTDAAVASSVADAIAPGDATLVILGSEQERGQALAEIHTYAPLVSERSYMVVENTATNSDRLDAVEEFLAAGGRFVVDRRLEKFFMTFNPCGYLWRLPDAWRRPDGPAAAGATK